MLVDSDWCEAWQYLLFRQNIFLFRRRGKHEFELHMEEQRFRETIPPTPALSFAFYLCVDLLCLYLVKGVNSSFVAGLESPNSRKERNIMVQNYLNFKLVLRHRSNGLHCLKLENENSALFSWVGFWFGFFLFCYCCLGFYLFFSSGVGYKIFWSILCYLSQNQLQS